MLPESRLPRPRVVFIDHSLEPGGAEFALARLLRTQQSWEASLALPPGTPSNDVFADLPNGVTVTRSGPRHSALSTSRHRRLAMVSLLARLAGSALALIRSRMVRRADILVANTTRAAVYTTLAAMVLRKPTAIHIRDLVEPEAIGAPATTLMRRLVLPRAAVVIANSRAALALVADHLSDRCAAVVIPSPSGLSLSSPDSARTAQPVRAVGMVARIDPWKGQDLLVRAFAASAARDSARLVLVGGAAFGHEEYLADLRRLVAELGIADRVDFTGHVDDVTAAIDALDVCVQSSVRAEPLGQNVLQYLAASKPTIVADEGGPAEWVTDGVNGLIFHARDAASLADALGRLTQDSALRTRIATAASSTPGLETDDQIGRRIADVLTAAVEARG